MIVFDERWGENDDAKLDCEKCLRIDDTAVIDDRSKRKLMKDHPKVFYSVERVDDILKISILFA